MPRTQAQPFLKWAGGKRQLLSEIHKHIPEKFATYYEPFLGAGAVLFSLQPAQAVINDINEELVNCYAVIRDSVDELIASLKRHTNDQDYYYWLRDLDRQECYRSLSPVERASRILYLNKTCFNGLFRVNSQGYFNVPYGRYAKPKIVDEPVLRAVHEYLAGNDVRIENTDFEEALKGVSPGDFVYLDPPYDPVSDTSSFTGYSLTGFSQKEQKRLKKLFDELTAKGCYALLSNSATPLILELYQEYDPIFVSAKRAINSKASGRGKIGEVLVNNFAHLKRKA